MSAARRLSPEEHHAAQVAMSPFGSRFVSPAGALPKKPKNNNPLGRNGRPGAGRALRSGALVDPASFDALDSLNLRPADRDKEQKILKGPLSEPV